MAQARLSPDHDDIFDSLKNSVVNEAMRRHSWEEKVRNKSFLSLVIGSEIGFLFTGVGNAARHPTQHVGRQERERQTRVGPRGSLPGELRQREAPEHGTDPERHARSQSQGAMALLAESDRGSAKTHGGQERAGQNSLLRQSKTRQARASEPKLKKLLSPPRSAHFSFAETRAHFDARRAHDRAKEFATQRAGDRQRVHSGNVASRVQKILPSAELGESVRLQKGILSVSHRPRVRGTNESVCVCDCTRLCN